MNVREKPKTPVITSQIALFQASAARVGKIFMYVLESKDAPELRGKVLDFSSTVLLNDAEAQALDAIKKFHHDHGKFPTFNYLVEELKMPIPKMPGDPPSNVEVQDLIKREGEYRKKATVVQKLGELSDKIMDMTDDDIGAVLSDVTNIYYDRKERAVASAKEAYIASLSKSNGLLTHIPQIDRLIKSIVPGSTFCVSGYAGNFKTQTCISMLYGNAVHLGYNCAYITLEVPREHVQYQLLSRHSTHPKFKGVCHPYDWQDILQKNLTEDDARIIFDILEPDLFHNKEYGKMDIFDVHDFEILRPEVFKKVILSLPHETDAVFVDYVQQLEHSEFNQKFRHVSQQANVYVRELAKMALNFGGRKICMILAAQTNNQGYEKAKFTEGRYDMKAIGNLYEIARASYYVMTLYADDRLKADNNVKIQLLKHRGGLTLEDPIKVFVDPRYCQVGSAADDFFDHQDRDYTAYDN